MDGIIKAWFLAIIYYAVYRVYLVIIEIDLPTSNIPIFGDLFIPVCFLSMSLGIGYGVIKYDNF